MYILKRGGFSVVPENAFWNSRSSTKKKIAFVGGKVDI